MTASDAFVIDPTGRDNHGEAARLRTRGAATRVVLPDGVAAWSVTSHDVIKRLLRDPNVSKDPNQHWRAWRDGEIAPDWPLFVWVALQNMFTAYGTAHTRLRTIVAKALTPRRTALLAPRVREITGELLDRLAATPAGDTTDLRAALAYPVPIQVVCDLFEVPPEARQHVLRFGELAFNGATEPGVAEAIQQRLVTTLTDMVGTRGATPGDDMVSDLIAARDDGDGSRLTGQELLDTLILVLSAGFETTINLLDNAIFALLSHPGQLALVHAGDATWDDVIEEALRWQAPVPNVPMRYAVEDLRLPDGTVIPRGDAIIVSFGAAGRDPAQHGADADDFDVRRATRRDHLAFGHGVHYCLGVSLARLEAGTVLPALFARFPDMTLAVPAADVAPIGSFLANGHRTLPVVLRPA